MGEFVIEGREEEGEKEERNCKEREGRKDRGEMRNSQPSPLPFYLGGQSAKSIC